ncbi:MAG: chromosomal replication initiator protein DnaA [Hyphomicrobium sp.]|uniref:chromosomal replication initiator protein DnaA n=3 Tax=Hyphomicrobium sp. TaxID=82 RepID=UPI0022C89521|nr:chromosomal replication initiator protein DnaA [Hyphomicrobium sp.]MBZ0209639.1 chromosomal replication initiator protein DnaA [Hyphomicrobium sp.]MCZ7595816.1 chromosomal replication initiator protein DnaA [Hyphomicrobium sp.]
MQTIQKAERAVAGGFAGAASNGLEERTTTNATTPSPSPAITATNPEEQRGQKVRAMLRARLGDDIFTSWFNALDFESFEAGTVKFSVPVKFLRTWIQSHYSEDLLACCRAEFKGAEKVEVVLRQPGNSASARAEAEAAAAAEPTNGARNGAQVESGQRGPTFVAPVPAGRTSVGGFEGSPLDPRYTFESFVVGASNRMAHAGATQVAETALGEAPGFNPLYIHSAVGLGKTHLLHAIAWEVKRRSPNAQVLYLTAERFRYQFVEALRSQDPLAFKEKFRGINVLLIDDLEFMHGERTEQEFDHIINSLLDGGRQVVVASARAPNHVERLNERMRSRLQRGLVTEIGTLDHELRLKVLEKRLAEKRANDPSFTLSREILALLAERLTESGRELEGAITRLYATWQYMRTSITPDVAETVIRDLVQGLEPRRIKIEDILRIISRHFGVSKGDLLSQRRHRSVVWPRQVGMYLAKQLTARSLPEIGRRFGNRDHTTVLHAIRKIEGELSGNPRLKEELEELKRLLSH